MPLQTLVSVSTLYHGHRARSLLDAVALMIHMHEIYLEYFRCIISCFPTQSSVKVWKHIALHAEHNLDNIHQNVSASLDGFLLHWFDDSLEDAPEGLMCILRLKGSERLAGSCLSCMQFIGGVQGVSRRFWCTLLLQDIRAVPDRRKLLLTCQSGYITFVNGSWQGHCSQI